MSVEFRTPRRRAGRSIDAVVVGAGHSGLAMSRCLAQRSIEHVVLERGEIGNAWRHERWDSLRLLTPNWQATLPDYAYSGDDPDGFMTMPEVIEFVAGYAGAISAPVRTGTDVTAVSRHGDRYRVETTRGTWFCRAVVIASGAFELPNVPKIDASLPQCVSRMTSKQYRNAEQLADNPVLIVGASASGLQLASEIRQSGRPVTLAVGEHIRMPRRYRGRDIQWWMSSAGVLDQMYTEVDDIGRARRVPSPQLIGTPDGRTLDLNELQANGVRIVGRLVGINDGKAQFSGSLPNHCEMADLKLHRLLNAFDEWATAAGLDSALDPIARPEPTRVEPAPPLSVDLAGEKIRTVIWATGYRPNHRWIELPIFDRKGNIQHDGGVVRAPGIYILGLPFMRRRKSSYIHGAEDDARDLSDHLVDHLHASRRAGLSVYSGTRRPILGR